jgi:hypothetical protein
MNDGAHAGVGAERALKSLRPLLAIRERRGQGKT